MVKEFCSTCKEEREFRWSFDRDGLLFPRCVKCRKINVHKNTDTKPYVFSKQGYRRIRGNLEYSTYGRKIRGL